MRLQIGFCEELPLRIGRIGEHARRTDTQSRQSFGPAYQWRRSRFRNPVGEAESTHLGPVDSFGTGE
jgi:hypothetical protein